jgi:hypothetical protein
MKSQIKHNLGKFTAIIMLLTLTQSCRTYYKVAMPPDVAATPAGIIQANPQRYYVLRTGSNAFSMNNIALSKDEQALTCVLDTLPPEHKLHLHKGREGNMHYKRSGPEAAVITEVHLYVPQDTAANIGATYTLALNHIQKIEVLEKDKQRTSTSYVFGGVLIVAGAVVVLLSIAVASFSAGWAM